MVKRSREPNISEERSAEDAAAAEAAEATANEIMEMREDDLLDLLDDLVRMWMVETPPTSFQQFLGAAFKNFGRDQEGDLEHDDQGSYGIRKLETNIHLRELETVTLYGRMKELDLLENQNVMDKIRKVSECIFYAKRIVLATYRAKIAIQDNYQLEDEIEERLGSLAIRFRWIDEKLSDSQKLILYLLDVCMERRYKKFGDSLYEPIIVNNHNTHAYRRVCDIKTFVHDECKKEVQLDAFLQLTSKSNTAGAIISHLTDCTDFQLPRLERSRTHFSFRNGVYSCAEDKFYMFGTDRLPDNLISARFFDCDVPDVIDMPWRDIHTPNCDKIFLDQGFNLQEREWFNIFAGRMIYPIGQLDGWQCVPFLLGIAGSGKSTITDLLIGNFYSRGDVGVISNNCEAQWVVGSIIDKFIWIAPETKENFALEQAQFQSMISGESISVSVKFQTPYQTTFTIPGFMAGNVLPKWRDNAGSIKRRLVIFRFDKRVEKTDANLGKRLIEELPWFIIKVNRAYLEAANAHGNSNIWEVLPEEFEIASDAAMSTLSVVDAFMRSSYITLEPETMISVRKFKMLLKAFILENNLEEKGAFDAVQTALLRYGVSTRRTNIIEDGIEALEDVFVGLRYNEPKRVPNFGQDDGL
jgi:hypothetical protein